MDFVNAGRRKKKFITKAWKLCRSILRYPQQRYLPVSPKSVNQSKAWYFLVKDDKHKTNIVAPEGCFSVYVGSEKQRFVVKTDCANHPLFRKLLEEAELEYGYNSEGPILLLCEVDLFRKVLAEMDSKAVFSSGGIEYCSCSPFGYGSYGHLTPLR